MIVLSVDTSSSSASLGIFRQTENSYDCLFLKSWQKDRSHSEVITDYFVQALKSNNLKPNDLSLICLGNGPGSFTGIRVALNFAKAIAYSYSIPIYSVNSLLPIAFKNKEHHPRILVLNNAFRNMVYGAGYTTAPFAEVIKPFAVEPEKIEAHLTPFNLSKKILVLGNAFSLYKSLFSKKDLNNFILRNDLQYSTCAESIYNYFRYDKSPVCKQWNEVTPLYIRGSEAEEKLKLKLSR